MDASRISPQIKKKLLYKIAALSYRTLQQIIWISPANIASMFTFFLPDYAKYKKLAKKRNQLMPKFLDIHPIVGEKTATTGIDKQYFHQSIWAAHSIYNNNVKEHVDVGSHTSFVGGLTPFTKVTFIDIRPLEVSIPNLINKKGSILAMPYKNNSVKSLSCLHVAEHIGLGRYGDPLDPEGSKKAAKELARVLAKGGTLYFSGPIGKPRICFNAHRVHSPQQILDYFSDLTLVEMQGIDDFGNYILNPSIKQMSEWTYGCGLFKFTKK